MTLYNFLKDPIFNIPSQYSCDFTTHVEDILIEGYLKKLKSIKLPNPEINTQFYEPLNAIIEKQESLIEGLLKTVRLYLDGHSFKAYECLNNTLTINNIEHPGLKRLISVNASYIYRARDIKNVNNIGELFHIPFEDRGKVKNQRYSISGIPTLYLSNNLYTCWKELNCPKIEDLSFIKVRTKNLNFFNLTWNPCINPSHIKSEYYSLMIWPLIAICSIKVKNIHDTFKPEYIIPQLLLQWIRNNKKFDGIVYDSTHIDKNSTPQKGFFFNIAIPVKENNKYGYCTTLANSLFSTIPIETSKIMTPELNLKKGVNWNTGLRDTIIQDENNNTKYIQYNNSIFSLLEMYAFQLPEHDLIKLFKK